MSAKKGKPLIAILTGGGDVPGLGGLGQNAMLAYLMRDQGQGQDKVSLQDLVRYFGGGR